MLPQPPGTTPYCINFVVWQTTKLMQYGVGAS